MLTCGMKLLLLPLVLLTSSCTLADDEKSPAYRSEASLPKGWPKPGPYNEVSEKTYPPYRAAFTDGTGSTGAFWRLFKHIKRKEIPMTAPVEMTMEKSEKSMRMASMAFLYQSTEVGETGTDGEKIEIRDIPSQKVLSYTWMGPRNESSLTIAKAALEQHLNEKKLVAASYRLLGYNGPGTPKKKRTHELQAILK